MSILRNLSENISTVLALVALDIDGIEHVGSGSERHPELALS